MWVLHGVRVCTGLTALGLSLMVQVSSAADTLFTSGFEGTAIATVDARVGSLGWNSSIAIGADGLPVISYHDSTAGLLKVAKYNDPACAGGDETLSYVDYPVNRVGWDPAIAIGIDGLPVISYFDIAGGALKVAYSERGIES